jgi:hypothetical protein
MTAEMENKLTSGFWGFALGAIVAVIIGFNWGGWTTSSTTQKMNEEAVLSSRAAICVAQFMNAKDHKANVKEFTGAESYKKSELIEKGGWDRMPGEEKAAWGVAGACVAGVETRIKTGA